MARRCGCRAAMAGKIRYQGRRSRNKRVRTRRDDLVDLHARADRLVGVLQSREAQGAVWRPGPDGDRAWRNLAVQTRFNVAAVVADLRDPDSESRFRHLGRCNAPTSRSNSPRDDGCDDSDRLLRVVANSAKRHQRRSPG